MTSVDSVNRGIKPDDRKSKQDESITVVIVAGGAGTRLWPLSTRSQPKQFLPLTNNPESLLRQTYDRVRPLTSDIFVVAPRSQASLVRQNLPDLDSHRLIVEPTPRGVGNAIALAFGRLLADQLPARPLLFLWSDHWIGDEDRLRQSIELAASAVESGLKLVRFGVQPTFAATNFGYIQLGPAHSELDQTYQLEAFCEKPDRSVAEDFLAGDRHLWNIGYFMATADNLKQVIAETSPSLSLVVDRVRDCSETELDDFYHQLPTALFEREVGEKMVGAHVIRCDFPWADIGNFRDLLSALPVDQQGNFTRGLVHGRQLTDCYVDNQTNTPLAVAGLENLAVVVTDHGILVADPNQVAEIGRLAELIQTDDPTKAGQSS